MNEGPCQMLYWSQAATCHTILVGLGIVQNRAQLGEISVSSHKVAYAWVKTRFAALELHSDTPIAWIVAGLTHLDFINPGQI